MKSLALQAVAAAVVASLTGCSALLIERLPADPPADEPPDCTSGFGLPLADAGLAVLWGVGAVALLSAAADDDNDGKGFGAMGAGAGLVSVAHVGSAGYGAWQRGRCAEARAGAPIADPNRYTPDKPGAGTLGGPCHEDGSCDGVLVCDPPMNSCILPP